MEFANPGGGYDLLLLGVFLLAYILIALRLYRISQKIPTSLVSLVWKFLLRVSVLALILLSLRGPSFGNIEKEVIAIGKDIYILVDLSNSMNANDIQPSRLERVKFELKSIVTKFASDRKGLIIFGKDAFVQCPLTYDNSALVLFINTLHTSLVPKGGTDYAPALQLGLKKLESEEGAVSRVKSKIIILISDGEDFGKNTNSVVNDIQEAGIQMYTLGVGTDRGTRLLSGGTYKRDSEGKEVVTKLTSSSLRRIAVKTGGRYYEINDEKNEVSRMINDINLIEGERRGQKTVDAKANKYQYFLLAALILLLVDSLSRINIVRLT